MGESREPTATEPMRLRRLNRWQVVSLQGDLADLYMDSAVAGPPGEGFRGGIREGFLERCGGALRQPGFALVIAETTGLAGWAFGWPVRGDGTWWLGFDGAPPLSTRQLTGSDRAFAITRILVHPHPRGVDVARRLQERLLTDHQASLGVTLVDRTDRSLLTAPRSWGWRDIGDVRRLTDDTVSPSLVLALGERTTVRLEGLDHLSWTRESA
jgi:GNAT superfamily N-acetyltransferase